MGQYDKRVQWAAVAVLLLLCGGIFVAAMYSERQRDADGDEDSVGADHRPSDAWTDACSEPDAAAAAVSVNPRAIGKRPGFGRGVFCTTGDVS